MDAEKSPHAKIASLADINGLLYNESEMEQVSSQEAAQISDDTIVCWCNNVSAVEIREVLRDGTAHDLESVQRCTRASGGCGKCLPKVSAIVDLEVSRLASHAS